MGECFFWYTRVVPDKGCKMIVVVTLTLLVEHQEKYLASKKLTDEVLACLLYTSDAADE